MSQITVVPYDQDAHEAATIRNWKEISWIDPESKDKDTEIVKRCLGEWKTLIGLYNGSPEASSSWTPGTVRIGSTDLSLCAITGVTTSRYARVEGLASRVTVSALHSGAQAGMAVAALGCFDQGFYNRFGFGNGPYIHILRFDPATLRVDRLSRAPDRLDPDNTAECHEARLRRHRTHGAVNIPLPVQTELGLFDADNPLGVGFRDSSGELSHHMWLSGKDRESGPLSVDGAAVSSPEQWLELLGYLRSLSSDVRLIRMGQPPGLQLLDLIHQPFRNMEVRFRGEYQMRFNMLPYYQLRILDMEACASALDIPGPEREFTLRISDPVAADFDSEWPGTSGDYRLVLGSPCQIQRLGRPVAEPDIRTSIGAFTRWWAGVLPAASLVLSDEFRASPGVCAALDSRPALPPPLPDWDF